MNLSRLFPTQTIRSLSTTVPLENKRFIKYILARRKALRLKKMKHRFANDIALERATHQKWENDRYSADLELVWRQNGLDEEPPILTPEEKEKKLREWYESGQILTVMSHEELSDYNTKLGIRSNSIKTQPWVWRTLENPMIPRHQRGLFESKNYIQEQGKRSADLKFGCEDPDTMEGVRYFKEKGKEFERKRAEKMKARMPDNSFNAI